MSIKPDPLLISRFLPAPRKTVFAAFSSAEHIKQWFSPEGLTTPHAEVDFRPGGAFVVCMRMPDGAEHWSRGNFTDVQPFDRLGFVTAVGDVDNPGFIATTTVTFADEGEGTRLKVVQEYDIRDPATLGAVTGAPEGWRTTLDKLERLVSRMAAEA